MDSKHNINVNGTVKSVDWWAQQSDLQYRFQANAMGKQYKQHEVLKIIMLVLPYLYTTLWLISGKSIDFHINFYNLQFYNVLFYVHYSLHISTVYEPNVIIMLMLHYDGNYRF